MLPNQPKQKRLRLSELRIPKITCPPTETTLSAQNLQSPRGSAYAVGCVNNGALARAHSRARQDHPSRLSLPQRGRDC